VEIQMRRMNSDTLLFDDVKVTSTKDQELGLFNAVDQCAWSSCLLRKSVSRANLTQALQC